MPTTRRSRPQNTHHAFKRWLHASWVSHPHKQVCVLPRPFSFLLVFYGDAVCFRPSSESFGNDDRAIFPRCATPSLRVAAVSLHLFHDRNFSSGYLRENLPEMLIRTGTTRRTRLCNRPPSAAPVQKKEVCARENAAGTKRLGPSKTMALLQLYCQARRVQLWRDGALL